MTTYLKFDGKAWSVYRTDPSFVGQRVVIAPKPTLEDVLRAAQAASIPIQIKLGP